MALRDLFMGVDFDVNSKELKAGDRAMDSLADETRRAGSSMKMLDNNSKKAGGSLKKIGKTVGAFVGIYELGRGLKYSLKQASDLNEETDKFNTVFGKMRQEAGLWAEDYADRTNSSVVETRSAIAENQNLLVGFGATREEGFKLSTQMQELAGDLSAMNNIEKDLVSNNLQSVMLGQHQAGKSLGLAITETSLQQEALNQGYKKSFRELDPLVKMQLRFDLAMKQSQDSIGKAESEAGTFAGQMRGMKANLKDTAAEAGQNLIPIVGKMLDAFNDNQEAITEFVTNGVNVAGKALEGIFKTIKFGVEVAGKLEPIIWGLAFAFAAHKIIAAGSAILTGYRTLVGLQTVLGTKTLISTAAQWLWVTATSAMGVAAGTSAGVIGTLNAIMLANPIGAIVVGVGLLVAGFKLLGDKVKWIGDLWDNTIGKIWGKFKKFIGIAGTETDININETTTTKTAGSASTSKAGVAVKNQYARGTNSAEKGLALVGEEGPELINMRGGEKVTNNRNTNKILNRNSGPKINITVNGSDSPQTTADTVRNEIDKYFRKMRLKGGYA